MEKTMDVDDKLIQLIKQYPYLYDFDNSQFRDAGLKQDTWLTIAHALELPVEAVHRRWKNLRDRFTRERRLTQRNVNGSHGVYVSRWDHYSAMSFFSPFLKGRRRYLRHNFFNYQFDVNAFASTLPSENSSSNTVDAISLVVPKLEASSPSSVEGIEDETSRSDTGFPTAGNQGKKRTIDEVNDVCEVVKESSNQIGDDCYCFGMYVYSMLKRLSPRNCSLAKMRVMEVLHQVEFNSTT